MTHRGLGAVGPSLVLSTFTGAGLLDRGLREAGWCVVSAGDALWGQPLEEFHGVPGVFAGVVGGPPCQKFSRANRTNRDVRSGLRLVRDFFRVVSECAPEWWLMENVDGLPDVSHLAPDGYSVQRIHLNARELGFAQNRPRWYVFGYSRGGPLVIPRVTELGQFAAGASRCALASEGARQERRSWADFCALQGVTRDFTFPPGLSRALQYRLIGNGVHVGVARVLGRAIAERGQALMALRAPLARRVCVCECGREVPAHRTMATAACRKRMQRRRDAAGMSEPGPVAPSLF